MGVLESFQAYCRRKGITSEQYIDEIWPVWEAAYKSGKSNTDTSTPNPQGATPCAQAPSPQPSTPALKNNAQQ